MYLKKKTRIKLRKNLLEIATDFDSLESITKKETNIPRISEISKYLAEIKNT